VRHSSGILALDPWSITSRAEYNVQRNVYLLPQQRNETVGLVLLTWSRGHRYRYRHNSRPGLRRFSHVHRSLASSGLATRSYSAAYPTSVVDLVGPLTLSLCGTSLPIGIRGSFPVLLLAWLCLQKHCSRLVPASLTSWVLGLGVSMVLPTTCSHWGWWAPVLAGLE